MITVIGQSFRIFTVLVILSPVLSLSTGLLKVSRNANPHFLTILNESDNNIYTFITKSLIETNMPGGFIWVLISRKFVW